MTFSPSGDHARCASLPLEFVSLRRSVPSGRIVKTSKLSPSNRRTNAIRSPRGDQTGKLSYSAVSDITVRSFRFHDAQAVALRPRGAVDDPLAVRPFIRRITSAALSARGGSWSGMGQVLASGREVQMPPSAIPQAENA